MLYQMINQWIHSTKGNWLEVFVSINKTFKKLNKFWSSFSELKILDASEE